MSNNVPHPNLLLGQRFPTWKFLFLLILASSSMAASEAKKTRGTRKRNRNKIDPPFHEKLFHAPVDDNALTGKYIVVFTEDTTDQEMDNIIANMPAVVDGVVSRESTFRTALKAVAISVQDKENDDEDEKGEKNENIITKIRLRMQDKLESLLDHEKVQFIEEQQIYFTTTIKEASTSTSATTSTSTLTTARTLEADTRPIITQYSPPSYGLDRMDQIEGLDNRYSYTLTGKGVRIFVIDTGIFVTHTDFGGRASCGFDYYGSNDNCEDGDGHGTHVAGTLGGTTYGVAKDSTLIAVKTLDSEGRGSTQALLAGIDYVAEQGSRSNRPVVANMSLTGPKSLAIDLAVERAATRDQVVVVAAAGNDNIDACQGSPGGSYAAITVSATDRFDTRTDYSNFGSCVNIFAPGDRIPSASNVGVNGQQILSGTSMASPHVAGVAALYIENDPSMTVDEIRERLYDDAIDGIVEDAKNGSANRLVSTGALLQSTGSTPPNGGGGGGGNDNSEHLGPLLRIIKLLSAAHIADNNSSGGN